MSGPDPAAPGAVLRISWVPGTDVLAGTCTCAARYECQDPVEMWDWLLAHPDHPEHPDRADQPDHPAAREDSPGERRP